MKHSVMVSPVEMAHIRHGKATIIEILGGSDGEVVQVTAASGASQRVEQVASERVNCNMRRVTIRKVD